MPIQIESNNTYSVYGQNMDSNSINIKEVTDEAEKKSSRIDYYEEYKEVIYGQKGIINVDENSRKFIEGMMCALGKCSEMECTHSKEDLQRAGEIYCITIRDGKVHVGGGQGYEDKAAAYEKLLNASFGYAYRWSWGGRMVSEESALNKLDEILHHYMDYDEKIYQKDNNDSIVNHIGEAFDDWYQNNKPVRMGFTGIA